MIQEPVDITDNKSLTLIMLNTFFKVVFQIRHVLKMIKLQFNFGENIKQDISLRTIATRLSICLLFCITFHHWVDVSTQDLTQIAATDLYKTCSYLNKCSCSG